MKVFTIGRLGGVVVLAGAMLVVAGAPAAATEAVCAPRTVSVSDDVEVEGGPSGGRQLSFVLTTTGCLAGTVEFVTSLTATTPGPWAIAPYDYTALGGTAAWARHSTSSITVSVPIVGDEWVELDENVTLVLRNPSSAVTLTETTAVGTISNDDLTQVGGDSEPDCGMTAAWTCPFTIELSRRVAFDVTVVFTTGNGTASAGQEFVGVPRGTVVIPAGALQGTATITLLPGFGLPTAKHFFVDLLETSVGTLGVSRLRLTIPAP